MALFFKLLGHIVHATGIVKVASAHLTYCQENDTMAYPKKTSIINQLTEREHQYTPYHNYNTRLSARCLKRESFLQAARPLPKQLEFQGVQHNGDGTYVLDQFEQCSDRFSATNSSCSGDPSESFFGAKNESCFEQRLKNTLAGISGRMDFDGPPCTNDKRRWMKSCGIVLVAAIIGWYVNHVRVQLGTIKAEVDSANGRIGDIVDARLDTLYRLSEVNNMVKDLKDSQTNFKYTIQKMIEYEIEKMYSDKTGRTDFALESAGGRIVQLSPGTENYGQPKSSLLGISLCEGMHGPRAMIQTGTSPGECWAFKGSNGGVVVKLLGPVKIDAISLEHISKTISPSGDSTTAPKDFTVWGLKAPADRGSLLGQFSYNINGPLVQMFSLSQSISDAYDFVELRILSNHGNPDFTCVYRFRVHGIMETAKGK